MLLRNFCASDIPPNKFNTYMYVSYTLFTPHFQLLAMIIRYNILPKLNNEMLFDFVDLKVMFLVLTNKINFNIGYVVLLNIIQATELGFFPYGLLLTSVFRHVEIPLLYPHSKRIYTCVTEKDIKRRIPLSYYVPQPHLDNIVSSTHSEFAILLTLLEKQESRHLDMSHEIQMIKGVASRDKKNLEDRIKELENKLVAYEANANEEVRTDDMVIELTGDAIVPNQVAMSVLFGDLPNNI